MRFGFWILLLVNTIAFAQDKREVWIDGRVEAGFLVAHRSSMGHLPTEHAFSGELSYIIQGKGERDWHYRRKFPRYGYTLFVGTTGNREILGYGIGGYGFVNLPMYKSKQFETSFKIGAGLGYLTKHYDIDKNPLNVAIGSHFNAMVVFALENRYQFGDNSVSMAIDMTHFSNGATKVPNLGLNLPHLSVSYARKIKTSDFCTDCPVAGLGKSVWEYGATFIGTSKEVLPIGSGRYPVFGLSLQLRRYFMDPKSFQEHKRGVEFSFDVMSKQAIKAYLPEIEKSQMDILQMGVFAGYLIPLDKLHMVVGMGAYVRDKYHPEDAFYHRLGLRYMFKNRLCAQVVLKSHWARADYIEYGIGYFFAR